MARVLAQAAIGCLFGTAFMIAFILFFGLVAGVPGTTDFAIKVLTLGILCGSAVGLVALTLGFFESLYG